MVNIKIEFNGITLTLPVNPEELKVTRSANNEKINVVGLGNIIIKKDESLKTTSIESFFPGANSQFYTGVSSKACVEFINTIWKSNKIPKIVTEGLPINLNMFFVINNFDYDHEAGLEEDMAYTLEISEYIPYGARTINMKGETIGIISSVNRVNTKPLISNVYTVLPGDSVISITKKLVGDASRWKELYLENTAIIGANSELITPGQKLILPESWVIL